jgi:SAM-dependent methyltransferase
VSTRLTSAMTRTRSWLLKQEFFTSRLLPALPRQVRWTLRKLWYMPIDAIERRRGVVDSSVPPKTAIFTGSVEGFSASGRRLLELLVEHAALAPTASVLDVGSGLGRLAVPLTDYLEPSGSYTGLDIVESGIRWCNENIAARHSNFRFTLGDVYNKEYNPGGRQSAAEYTFPYADQSFDVVVLMSVFTHMLPPDVERYVEEIGRVLRPGGRCFATFFLVNGESERLTAAGVSSLRFRHHQAPAWLVNRKVPELSVGYDEPYVVDLFARGQFVNPVIHYGGWCGRPALWSENSGLGDQDIVVAHKRAVEMAWPQRA